MERWNVTPVALTIPPHPGALSPRCIR
jgi:hypothetical protein